VAEVAAGRREQVVLVDRDVFEWLKAKVTSRGETVPRLAVIRSWLESGGMKAVKDRKTVDGHFSRVCVAGGLNAGEGWIMLQMYRVKPEEVVPM
jgi:hypothetical protein